MLLVLIAPCVRDLAFLRFESLRLCVRFWGPWGLGFLGLIGNAGFANLATKSQMVSVRIEHNKIPHSVGLIRRFHFHHGAVFLYFLTIVIDFVAKNKGGASAVWPLVNLLSAQMHAGVPVADTGIAAELKVLLEPKSLFIVFERAIEIAHLEDRAYPVGVHFGADPILGWALAKIRMCTVLEDFRLNQVSPKLR